MGTPCRDGNLTERLGLLRVPRQRLAAGTGKGITCFIDGPHPAGQAQLRLSRSRPASSAEYETDLGAATDAGDMDGDIPALGDADYHEVLGWHAAMHTSLDLGDPDAGPLINIGLLLALWR